MKEVRRRQTGKVKDKSNEKFSLEGVAITSEDLVAQSEGSSSDEPELTPSRARTLAQRKKQRQLQLTKHQKSEAMASMSFLEATSVGPLVAMDYARKLACLELCLGTTLAVLAVVPATVDAGITQAFNMMYADGHQADWGEKALAAFIWKFPQYGRYGPHKLARTARALKGWKRHCPARSRVPVPFPCVAAAVRLLVTRGYWTMGAWLLTAFSGYLRPSELMLATKSDLLPPRANICAHWVLQVCREENLRTTKTGEQDDTIIFDSKVLPQLGLILGKVKAAVKGDKLWTFSYPELVEELRVVSKLAGLPVITPYQMRHAGPSWDALHGNRTDDQIKRRGRWKTDKSVRRYQKAGRLVKAFAVVPPAFAAYHQRCVEVVEDVVLGKRQSPAPPLSRLALTA